MQQISIEQLEQVSGGKMDQVYDTAAGAFVGACAGFLIGGPVGAVAGAISGGGHALAISLALN